MSEGRQIGKYRLTEKIGEGGMAEVWKCVDTAAGGVFAIKFLLPGLAGVPELEHRFLHEGKRLEGLRHPNLVAAVDFLVEDGHNYLVMNFVEGVSLEDWIARVGGPFPLQHVLTVARGVLGGLGFAHASGVVHRDVKPSNILVNPQGVPMLTDFGIALAVGQKRLTRTGTVMGTPHYMSPEQIMAPSTVGPRSDLYNFGVVLYELLTGRVPFDAEEGDIEYHVKHCHVRTPPPPLRQINPSIPEPVEAVVLCALAKQQEQRFATCEEMLGALETAATGVMPALPTAQGPALVPRQAPPTVKLPPQEPPAQPIPATHKIPHSAQVPEPKQYRSKAPLVAALAIALLFLSGGAYAAYRILWPRLFGTTGSQVVTLPPGQPPVVEPPPPPTPPSTPPVVETPPPPEPVPTTPPPKREPPIDPRPVKPPKGDPPVSPPPVILPPANPPPANPPVVTPPVVTNPPVTEPPPPKTEPPKQRVPVFRPDLPPVKPVDPPKPVYSGPRSGSFQWSVQLRKDALITLTGNVPSDGTVSGQLPPAGFPYEIVSIAHRDVGVQQAPGPSNGWNRLVLRSMKNQNVVVSVTWKLLE